VRYCYEATCSLMGAELKVVIESEMRNDDDGGTFCHALLPANTAAHTLSNTFSALTIRSKRHANHVVPLSHTLGESLAVYGY